MAVYRINCGGLKLILRDRDGDRDRAFSFLWPSYIVSYHIRFYKIISHYIMSYNTTSFQIKSNQTEFQETKSNQIKSI